MPFKSHWTRMVRKSDSSDSTTGSEAASRKPSAASTTGNFLTRAFSWRTSKTSSSTAATSASDRASGSSHSAVHPGSAKQSGDGGSTAVECPQAAKGKGSRRLPMIDSLAPRSSGYETNNNNMTEDQRHQARLRAYTIKFGATHPYRTSMENISPCTSRRPSLSGGYI